MKTPAAFHLTKKSYIFRSWANTAENLSRKFFGKFPKLNFRKYKICVTSILMARHAIIPCAMELLAQFDLRFVNVLALLYDWKELLGWWVLVGCSGPPSCTLQKQRNAHRLKEALPLSRLMQIIVVTPHGNAVQYSSWPTTAKGEHPALSFFIGRI